MTTLRPGGIDLGEDCEFDQAPHPDELRVPLTDWMDPAMPAGTEGGPEANIVRSID